VPGKDQVELIGGSLHIGPPQPKPAYGTFELQTGTALQQTDAKYKFLLAPNRDVVAVKQRGTDSGTTEIHVLAADKTYQAFSTQTKTAQHETDDNWDFGIAANRDVFAIKKNGTDSKTTELHILSADSGYQKFALQTKTALHEADHNWAFAVAENRDVFAIRKNGGGSGKIEVHVLAADSGYQKYALQTPTALPASDENWEFSLAANRDVFALKKNGTGSGTTCTSSRPTAAIVSSRCRPRRHCMKPTRTGHSALPRTGM